jgi:hypothetical protein
MQSFTGGQTLFTTLSQNTTAANLTLYGLLANIEHRYLLQKFFANEGGYSIATIGQTSLTLSAAVSIGATSATLAASWPYQTVGAEVTFPDGEVVNATLTNGSTTMTWSPGLAGNIFYLTNALVIGATSAVLSAAWSSPSGAYLTAFSDGSTKTVTFTNNSTAISWTGGLANNVLNQVFTSVIASGSNPSVGGVQFYPMPPNYSKLKDITITVGVLKWTLDEVRTREEWDNLNVFPYYASIPSKFFIYPGGDKGGKIGIWPIPSTTGNTITFHYKYRVPDLSIADYSTGTVTLTNGSTAVTGSSTVWTPTTNSQLESRWIQIAQTAGDNLWYQVQSVNSATSLTLYQPYQGINVSGGSYTLGQMPLVAEDFQDMMIWKALQYYFTSLVDNEKKAEEYKAIYDTKLELLKEYSGSNSINVNLSRKGIRKNPNLYGQRFG